MEKFNDEKYLYLHNAKLDFNWINKEGRKIEVLANDLINLGGMMGLDNHEVDEQTRARGKELME